MALSSSTRPLLVPAADVLAKNMQALDAARVPPAVVAASRSSGPRGTRRTLIGLGAEVEDETMRERSVIRFRRAPDDPKPSSIAALLQKLFPKKLTEEEKAAETARRKREKSPLHKAMAKYMPLVEKAAALASRLPDPTVLFLGLVLLVLLVERTRPHWLAPLVVKLGVIASFMPLLALAMLWRKTELFAQLREGQNPLSHPTEHCLDGLETQLAAREEAVKTAQETLKKNRAQLDALRKELAKDPNAANPEAVIVPSRKAAAMIAAGALGAGYDAEKAQAVEHKRMEENMKRSREAWKAKTEEADDDAVEKTKERIKLMADHSATAYTKRTREIKSRGATQGGALKSADKFLNMAKGAVRKEESKDSEHGASRRSEVSIAGSGTSTTSTRRRRLRLFRKKRRESTVTAGEGDAPSLSLQESGVSRGNVEA